jgi:hypothetical protein
LTLKSQILNEHVLRDHAGWSMTSKIPQVYIHYFGTESSTSLLKAYGIEKEDNQCLITKAPKSCPNCNESNKPESPFCIKCKMVLSYDSYNEARGEDKHKIEKLEVDMESLKLGMNKIFMIIQQNPLLINVKPDVLANRIE